jgi:phosphatidylserine/phosphatidylglycerophosphate/cardiolipin synthase-like enzyme
MLWKGELVQGSSFIRGIVGGLLVAGVVCLTPTTTTAAGTLATSPVVNVWSEPSSGYGFLDSAITSARHSIDLSVYELSDPTIEHALIARANAGVDVRVLLNADYEGTRHNAKSYALLHASKVHVEWTSANQIFHAKYVVVDGRAAYIGTGNLETTDYSSTRDFWVEVTRSPEVSAVERTFNADVAHSHTTTQAAGLVWSPGSAPVLVSLIDSARRSVLVENEEMDSASIEAALRSAALRGVSVKVVMSESPSWTAALDALVRNGVHVRVLSSAQVYIHAKVICVDCVGSAGTVFIGSENFSTSSLSYNRELGLITTTPKAVFAVDSAVNSDYAVGTTVTGARATTPPTTPGAGSAVTITSFEGAISPGDEDSLSVHSSKPNDSCNLEVTLPSGYTSESHGLGIARANAGGDVTWTWEIGTSTNPGTARASVTCASGRVQKDFVIR